MSLPLPVDTLLQSLRGQVLWRAAACTLDCRCLSLDLGAPKLEVHWLQRLSRRSARVQGQVHLTCFGTRWKLTLPKWKRPLDPASSTARKSLLAGWNGALVRSLRIEAGVRRARIDFDDGSLLDIEARKRNGELFVLFGPGERSVTIHRGGTFHLQQAGKPQRSWKFREEVLVEFPAAR